VKNALKLETAPFAELKKEVLVAYFTVCGFEK
jgi:hypothetical protein